MVCFSFSPSNCSVFVPFSIFITHLSNQLNDRVIKPTRCWLVDMGSRPRFRSDFDGEFFVVQKCFLWYIESTGLGPLRLYAYWLDFHGINPWYIYRLGWKTVNELDFHEAFTRKRVPKFCVWTAIRIHVELNVSRRSR